MKKWMQLAAVGLLAACGSDSEGETGTSTQCDVTTPCPGGFACDFLTGTCLPEGGGDAGLDVGADAGAPDATPDTQTDPCDGVSCTNPPANTCEGNVAVQFPATGTCSDGTCGYEETRDDCDARGLACMNGACVDPADPCAGFECVVPPASACEGDVVQRFALPGTCVLDDAGMPTCDYALETLDCTEFGNQCLAGACVSPDLCRDVDCSVPPAADCRNGETTAVYSAGVCAEGVCEYGEVLTDCTADGTVDAICDGGACVPRPDCFGITCDAPPLSTCDGTTLVEYDEAGVCADDTCTYDTTRIDCSATGQICQAGACVLPTSCDGELCASPPAPLCRGDIAIAFSNPGVCVEGTCRYDEIASDCAAADGYCDGGTCEFFEACLDLDCSVVPAPTCDDVVTVVTYVVPAGGPTCREGECVFDTELSECEDGLVCDDGACIPFDPCTGVVCDRAPFCDGEVAVTDDANGTCRAGVCDYTAVQRRVDCAGAGLSCLDGACVPPAAFLAPGDLLFTEYFNASVGEPTSWLELTNTRSRGVDISGLEIAINDEVITVPDGTLLPGYGALVLSNSVFEPDNFSGIEYETVLGTAFTVVATGSVEVDRLEVTPAFPHVETVSGQLDIGALFVGNDDVADWCLTDDGFFGTSTPGELSGPCGRLVDSPNIIVTEVMTTGVFRDLDEQYIEWFNRGDTVDLGGARLVSNDAAWTLPPGTVFEGDTYRVTAANPFMALGSSPTGWGDAIGIAEDEGTVLLFFGTRVVASLAWNIGDGWPDSSDGVAMQLGVSVFADEPDVPEAWCLGGPADEYAPGNFGTPGAPSSCTAR
jgi:hypothetical protein